MRVITYSVLAVFLILTFTTPALAAIGDQPAEQWNLQGDIQAEKEIEGQMFSIFSLGLAATAPGAAAVSGPFGLLVAGAGVAGAGLAQIASPENAVWENWPEVRYMFHHAPPDKFPGLGVMAEKALYSSVEFMANMVFSITKTLVRTSNNIMVLAYHTNIVTGMVGWVSEGMADIFSPGSDLTQLLMAIGLIILLVYGIFRILRGQAMSALSSLLVAVLAVGGAFFLTANSRQIISSTAEATDSLAGVFLATTGRYTSASQRVNVDDPVDRGLVAAGQTTWQLIVARPWALAQFGTFDEGRLELTQGEYDALDKSVFPRESQGRIRPGMRLDTLMLGSAGEGRDAVAEVLARPNKKYLWVVDGRDIDHGSHDGTMVGFSPESAIQHLKAALFTLLPAAGFALLAALVGLSIVICQVILAPLLLFLPLPLFAMMVPGAGWAFATRYFRTLLGFFMVKLVYGLYLSLTLVTGTAFAGALFNHNLGAAMVVLAVIFFAAAVYRKKFLNLVLDSVQKGALIYNNNVSLDRIVAANTALARKLGITDIISDWVFSRRRGMAGRTDQPPPSGAGGGPEAAGRGPEGFSERAGTDDGHPEDGQQEVRRHRAWEGQPPRGYPFKNLPEGRAEGPEGDVAGDGGGTPGGRGSGGTPDAARAAPGMPGRADGAAGTGTPAIAAAAPAGGAALVAGTSAASGVKDLVKGEMDGPSRSSGPNDTAPSIQGVVGRGKEVVRQLTSEAGQGVFTPIYGREDQPVRVSAASASPGGIVSVGGVPGTVNHPVEGKSAAVPGVSTGEDQVSGRIPLSERDATTANPRETAGPPKRLPTAGTPPPNAKPPGQIKMKRPPYSPRSRLRP
ncbi:MAG: hypothetical protein ACOY46_18785 [Bacillota bacterium]